MENTDQEKGFCSVDISVYLHAIVFIVLTTNSQTVAKGKFPAKSVHNGICTA